MTHEDLKNASDISYACADIEDILIERLKKYFTEPAWEEVKKIVAAKKDIPEEFWPCVTCKYQLQIHTQAIQCDSCLEWQHLKCTVKKTVPKGVWFCSVCRRT